MLVLIVAVVVLGAIFVVGALVGSSIAQNVAGDRARTRQRDLRWAGTIPAQPAAPGVEEPAATRPLSSRDVLTRDVVGHGTL